jgi:hypothetical protein
MSDNSPEYTMELDNDVGPNDDYYYKWYNILNTIGHVIAQCDLKEEAELILRLLNSQSTPEGAPKP